MKTATYRGAAKNYGRFGWILPGAILIFTDAEWVGANATGQFEAMESSEPAETMVPDGEPGVVVDVNAQAARDLEVERAMLGMLNKTELLAKVGELTGEDKEAADAALSPRSSRAAIIEVLLSVAARKR